MPLFEVTTPLGFIVHTTADYWEPGVLLFYRRAVRHWVVAVAKRADDTAFLVTAYQTDAIKEGEKIWPR